MSDPLQASVELRDEVYQLADAQIHDSLLDDMADRLNALICDNPVARRLYVDFLYDAFELHRLAILAAPNKDEASAGVQLMDAEIDVALAINAASFPLPTAATPSVAKKVWSYFNRHEMLRAYVVAIPLFVLLLGGVWLWGYFSGNDASRMRKLAGGDGMAANSAIDLQRLSGNAPINEPKQPTTPPQIVGRIINQADCRWTCKTRRLSDDPIAIPTDKAAFSQLSFLERQTPVALGDTLDIAAGLMEIAYDGGAHVILQGPCKFNVRENGGFLAVGRLTGRLDKKMGSGLWAVDGKVGVRVGRGSESNPEIPKSRNPQIPVSSNSQSLIPNPFVIATPSARITDLGTEFGVDVDKDGCTSSHVFRGRVVVVAMNGDAENGRSVTLGENQSARTEFERSSSSRRYVVVRSGNGDKKNAAAFVRQLPAVSLLSLNLADIVSGGDGRGWQKEMGVNPQTGEFTGVGAIGSDFISDGAYHRVAEAAYIDGVFIPAAKQGKTTLDSAGHAFQFPTGNGKTWAAVSPTTLKLFGVEFDTHLGGIDYDSLGHSILVMRANKGITFDLNAIRKDYFHRRVVRFSAVAGNLEGSRVKLKDLPGSPKTDIVAPADFWVFVDGEKREGRRNVTTKDGPISVDVAISDADRFLTLVATDSGQGDRCCWVVFGDPKLKLVWKDKE